MSASARSLLSLICVLSCLAVASRAAARSLLPEPQHIEVEGDPVQLDRDWTLIPGAEDEATMFAARWLADGLRDKTNGRLKLSIRKAESLPQFRIVLGVFGRHSRIDEALSRFGIRSIEGLDPEGYVLRVSKIEVLIAATADAGVFYGVQTLLQLVDPAGRLQQVSVEDYPHTRIRAVHSRRASVSGNPRSSPGVDDVRFSKDAKAAIDELARLKINTLIMRRNHDVFADKKSWLPEYQEVLRYCSDRHIELIPQVGNLSGSGPEPFDLLEGWHIAGEEFAFRERGGVEFAETPGLPWNTNLLSNGSFELGRSESLGWSIDDGTPHARWIRDKNQAFDGRFSMRLDAPDKPTHSGDPARSNTVFLRLDPVLKVPFLKPGIYLLTAVLEGPPQRRARTPEPSHR
jgi:hypothetical protein